MNNAESTSPEQPLEFDLGELRLVRNERRLYRRDGSAVELSPRQFDALLYFVERPGQLLDKESLLGALWPGLVVEDNNLNQLIMALRRALGDEASAGRWIQTVPRRGFRFVGAVSLRSADVAAPAVPAPPSSGSPDPGSTPASPDVPQAHLSRSGRRMVMGLVLVLLAAITALLLARFTTPAAAQQATLAILPFKPLALEGRDEVLEVGMADSLITRMSSIPGLVVRSIGSVRRFEGASQDPLQAAHELDVKWILEGAIQRRGERVRVTVRLLDAADGRAVWSGNFDDRFKDVFALQDSISQRVAEELAVQPWRSAPAPQAVRAGGSRDLAAYELYLNARYHAQGLRPDGLTRSIELFRGAVALDPAYALAYAGLADTYRRMAIAIDAPPADALASGREAAQRAVQIDPALAEAHAALGWMRWWADWDWPGAEQSFRRAIALNPNVAESQLGLGHLLCSQQRCDEGLAYVQRARELDPMSLITNVIEASYLRERGRQAESRARLDRALQIDPRFWPAYQLLAGLEVGAERPDGALAALREAQSLAPGSLQPTANIGVLLARAGQTEQARDVLAQMLELSERRYVPPMLVATLYCGLGEHDHALIWLDKARNLHDVNLPFLSVCSIELKDEARFVALLQGLRLPVWHEGFCAPLQAPAIACPS